MAMSTCCLSDSPPFVITPSTANPRCHWSNDYYEFALINFLLDHIAEVVDGGSFKSNILNTATVEMLKHTAKGGPKIAGKCKAKYVSVRQCLICNFEWHLNFISFKRSIVTNMDLALPKMR
jgi:hypothetical protein